MFGNRNARVAVLSIGSILGLVGMLGASPAQANCIRGDVTVHWSGQADQNVWPESYCFYEVGTGDTVSLDVDKNNTVIPTGLPSGAHIKVWVPLF